jgi:hypothetical protein
MWGIKDMRNKDTTKERGEDLKKADEQRQRDITS